VLGVAKMTINDDNAVT